MEGRRGWALRVLHSIGAIGAFVATLSLGGAAQAVSFPFRCLTLEDPGDCSIGEAQIAMDVLDLGGGQVEIKFSNLGPEQSTLARIYFDDGSLGELQAIVQDPNASDFVLDPFPGPDDLPGGQEAVPPFETTRGFVTGASDPPPSNGLEPGEMVRLIFSLEQGGSFASVVSEFSDGTVRAGVHVINFASGGSESLVSVPEPSALGLLGLGVGGLLATRTRRRA